MFTRIKLITPAEAKKLLEANTSNRPICKNTVARYARMMTNGEWQENGDVIRIGQSGRLLDGQHRLLAIIKSGKSYWYNVTSDIPDDAFTCIDTGRLRLAGDVFAIEGIPRSRTTAAVVRTCLALRDGHFFAAVSGSSPLKPSHQAILTEYRTNHDAYDMARKYAEMCRKEIGIMTEKDIGGIYAYLVIYRRHSHDKVRHFFRDLFFCEGHNRAVNLLRSRLLKDRLSKSRLTVIYKMKLIAKTWNAWLDGKELRTLKCGDTPAGKLTFN